MESNESSGAQVAEEMKAITVEEAEADCRLEGPQGLYQPPTAEEMSRLLFGKWPYTRVPAREKHHQFAHLLNRGSSLE